MTLDRLEAVRTLKELVSYRRLLVTFTVAGTMGVIEFLGVGHWIGLAFGLCMGTLALIVSPLPWLAILPWGLRRPTHEILLRALAVLLIDSVVVVVGFHAYFLAVHAAIPARHPLVFAAIPLLYNWSSIVVSIALFVAAGWGISRHMQLERRLEVRDEREIALRNALDEARMMAMQSRLDPHFLFNSLNLVAELCRDDPMEAERCVVRLSSLLRAALDRADQPMIPLSKEIDLCADYLELCRVRFGERLRVRLQRAPEVETVSVPSLAVQVLCENAVRHGIERKPTSGEVTITVQPDKERVIVSVTSPGPFLGERKGGIGLELTRKRLALAYRGRAHLDVRTSDQGDQTVARMQLPKMSAR